MAIKPKIPEVTYDHIGGRVFVGAFVAKKLGTSWWAWSNDWEPDRGIGTELGPFNSLQELKNAVQAQEK